MSDQRELDQALHLLNLDARGADPSLDDVRARVLAAARAERAPRARRGRAWWIAPVAAAAAAALVTGVVVVRGGDPSREDAAGGATSGTAPSVALLSAKEVLNTAADAIRTSDPQLAPGQYRYIREHAWYSRGTSFGQPVGEPETGLKGYTYLVETSRSVWIPRDATQDWMERREWGPGVKWLGGSVPESEATAPTPTVTDTGERIGKCGDFFPGTQPAKVCGDPADWDSPAFYEALPRDPAALVEHLRQATAHRGSSPATMFHWGVEILRAGLMPADLRASWYRALAMIEGVQVHDSAVTLDGRQGVAIGIDDPRERRDLIVDPGTGEFIGERTVAGPRPDSPWIAPGTVTGFSSITTKVVDGMGRTG